MSLRLKKTLGALLKGTVMLAALLLLDLWFGHVSGIGLVVVAALWLLVAGCTWWLNGTSRIAVAWQDRAEARSRRQVS
ncbi:hypothetical protein [Streptacidiphilus jiangxiensis]|uniref:Uncharacterized protein n=1 Tax=Streptacidiphilus jiangxiensis TaxID=235985 RepID=A0A1H7QK18_STRJI|nr:hypothetical protein [Streptacidiphilus jiangxiensis]SEL47935.1 hypothetical protein SAMN05414137_10950 [Streptacidiphilus jiangxiensis]